VAAALILISAGANARDPAPAAAEDAYTPLVASVLSAPAFPFLGSDQKYHIAYDLEIANASRVPATLMKVDVVDSAGASKVVASYAGENLVKRLRTLSNVAAADLQVAPSEGRVLWIDFSFASLDGAPKAVSHRLSLLGASGPPAKTPTPVTYTIAPYQTSSGQPLILAPPLSGKGWVALNGCCEPEYPHRTSFAPFNGSIINAQMFAIDWKRMDDQGVFYNGDKARNESYVDYGADVLAVANGTVIELLNALEPNEPGILPAQDPVKSALLTVQNVDGNHIVLDLGNGIYAFYAHLLKDSLTVAIGDKVTAGQKLARLGNTGNSNASHLHFHLMDGPSVLGSHGLPYVIRGFEYDGQVPPGVLEATDDFLTGNFGTQRLTTPQPRRNELPLALTIVNFPE
jgi:murein DD-endopeptidase MepM/ murein hydrolase activator NlpD